MGLLTLEMWLLLLIAFAIGLIVGWLIWGRLKKQLESQAADAERKAREAQAKADSCEKEKAELEQKLKSTSGGAGSSKPKEEASKDKGGATATSATATSATATSATATSATATSAAATSADTASKDTDEPASSEGIKPKALSAPEGAKDNLKKISGVGPKLETTLNDLGIFHFRQIAAWTEKEAEWVDGYLSFKGRIGREKWIEQAKTLASGG
jgi:predicted flap endonuclease-1-like 5' DNA nuclease